MESVNISPTKAFSNIYDEINKNLGESMDSKSIIIFITILVVFSLLFSNLGGSDSEISSYKPENDFVGDMFTVSIYI